MASSRKRDFQTDEFGERKGFTSRIPRGDGDGPSQSEGPRIKRPYEGDFKPKGEKAEESAEDNIDSLINHLGDRYNETFENNLEGLFNILSKDLALHRESILTSLLQCCEQIPSRLPVYAVLLGLLNARHFDFGEAFVDMAFRGLREALRVSNWDRARILIRLFSCLVNVHVVSPHSLVTLYDTLIQAASDPESPEQRSDWYVFAVLSSLPFSARELHQRRDEELGRVLEAASRYLSTRKKPNLSLLRCWHLPGEAPWEQSPSGASDQDILPQLDYLDSLWEQLCRLRDSRWIERAYAPAPPATGGASAGHSALLANYKPHAAFEHQLADAQTHNLPALPLPAHTPQAVYPAPLVVFRLFDLIDVPENMSLPPSNSIERFILEEHLRAVIAENSSDRKITAGAMSDLPVKNKSLALSYVQIEVVFSELLRLPHPPQSEIFYSVLLIELCKLQPNAMPQVLAQATEMLYDRLDRMQLECRDRLVRWFSYHLSNFQFLWTWADWTETLPPLPPGSADPATHPVLDQPKASFIRHVLLRCLRFSYHQRLVEMMPKGCEALLPANPLPVCKYDEESGASLASRAAALAFRNAITEAHASPEEAFKVIHDNLPNGLTLREMEELCVDVFFTIIFNVGSKTFSHMSSALEKYKLLAKSMLQKKLTMQEQALRIMHQVFKSHQQMQEFLVRKMLIMEIIDYPAIINWALSQEMFPFLTYQYIWEIVGITLEKLITTLMELDSQAEALSQKLEMAQRRKERAGRAGADTDLVLLGTGDERSEKATREEVAAMHERARELRAFLAPMLVTIGRRCLECAEQLRSEQSSASVGAAADVEANKAVAHQLILARLNQFMLRHWRTVRMLDLVAELNAGLFTPDRLERHPSLSRLSTCLSTLLI